MSQSEPPSAHSLHLVLRPGTNSTDPGNATTNGLPVPPLSDGAPSGLGAATLATQEFQETPNAQMPAQDPPQIPNNPAAFPVPNMDAHIQAVFRAQIAQLNYLNQRQPHVQHTQLQVPAGLTPTPFQAQVMAQARQPQPAPFNQPPTGSPAQQVFQQFVGQAQQARAAAGMQGIANNPGPTQATTPIHAGSPQPSTQAPQTQPPTSGASSFVPGPTTSYSREVQGPNGERWQVNVNENTMTFPQSHFQNIPPMFHNGNNRIAGAPAGNVHATLPIPNPQGQTLSPASASPPPAAGAGMVSLDEDPEFRARYTALQARLRVMQSDAQNNRRVSSRSMLEFQPEMVALNSLADRTQDPALQARQRNLIRDALVEGLDYMRSGLSSSNPSAPRSTLTPSFATTPATTTATSSSPNPSSMVYILSSPTGPYALLFTPSASYTSRRPGQFNIPNPPMLHLPPPPVPPHLAYAAGHNHANATGPIFRRQHFHHAGRHGADHGPADGRRQVQNDQAENPNAAAELVRFLLPLGGHLWLLIRLLGFVFFFTGGSGWRRTIMILIGALLVFLAQTPLFAGAQEALWASIRRHLEGLLPLAGGGGGGGGEAAPNEAPREGEAGGPDPAATAARLVRERRERRGWFRERLRGVERAVVLLLASLVPGVGERHVAARDAEAAVAARQADEQRVREEQARQHPDRRVEGEANGGGGGATGALDGADAQRQQEQQQQQPLVEI